MVDPGRRLHLAHFSPRARGRLHPRLPRRLHQGPSKHRPQEVEAAAGETEHGDKVRQVVAHIRRIFKLTFIADGPCRRRRPRSRNNWARSAMSNASEIKASSTSDPADQPPAASSSRGASGSIGSGSARRPEARRQRIPTCTRSPARPVGATAPMRTLHQHAPKGDLAKESAWRCAIFAAFRKQECRPCAYARYACGRPVVIGQKPKSRRCHNVWHVPRSNWVKRESTGAHFTLKLANSGRTSVGGAWFKSPLAHSSSWHHS